MKAVLQTAAGGVEVLQLAELAKPSLVSARHILVKLSAAGINPLDIKLRTKPGLYPDKLPAILGCDGAGVVEQVGREVTRFKVGDPVYFCHGGLGDLPGCYAEYTSLHEDFAALKPSSLSLVDSAAVPLVMLTAWEALKDRVNLLDGQTILIHGGAGGVGHIAVQLARQMGARVAVTVSKQQQAELCRRWGAEKIIFYQQQDFVNETLAWTQGQGADVVFDTVGNEVFLRSLSATRNGGKVVSILATAMSASDVSLARSRNLSLCFELMLTPQLQQNHAEQIRQRLILEQAAQLIDAGELEILISNRLPLAQVAAAHQRLEQGGMQGKLVLTI